MYWCQWIIVQGNFPIGLFSQLYKSKVVMMFLPNIPWKSLPNWLTGNRLRIIMVHSVSNNLADPHAISPPVFLKHLRSLQLANVISLGDGLKRLRSNQPLRNTIVITFDDALLDFFTTALPMLKDFGYPSTMFVPTGLVGQTSKWDTYDKTKPLMTWKQMEECQRWKVSFGSHTVNHPRLVECSNSELGLELSASLKMLNDRLDCVFSALAYPGGFHDQRIQKAAQNAGYTCAMIASSRWGNGPESDFYQLRRERFHP